MKERESLGLNNDDINKDNLINNEIKMTLEDFNALIMSFIDVEEFNTRELPFIFHISIPQKNFSIK